MDNFFSCIVMAVAQNDMRFSTAAVCFGAHWRAWRAGIDWAYDFMPGANRVVRY